MKLLVDIGNTRVKWALADADALRGPFAFARTPAEDGRSHVESLAEFWAEHWTDAWSQLGPAEVIVCSVAAPRITAGLAECVRGRWDLPLREIRPSAAAGSVRNGYRNPADLGADRWANLLGARALLGARDAVIVDAGTAVTVDGLRADGGHIGGAIFAGLGATRAALAAAAPRLPEADAAGELPAVETGPAVAAGTRVALAGGIDRVAGVVAADLDRPIWLLTGGDGEWLASNAPAWRFDSLLTLRGLLAAGDAQCAG